MVPSMDLGRNLRPKAAAKILAVARNQLLWWSGLPAKGRKGRLVKTQHRRALNSLIRYYVRLGGLFIYQDSCLGSVHAVFHHCNLGLIPNFFWGRASNRWTMAGSCWRTRTSPLSASHRGQGHNAWHSQLQQAVPRHNMVFKSQLPTDSTTFKYNSQV